MRIFLTIVLLLPTHIFAASNAEVIQNIVTSFSEECSDLQDNKAFQGTSGFSHPNDSVYDIKINSKGEIATVLYSNFSCAGVGQSYWCGSNGCIVYIIVNGIIRYKSQGFKPFSIESDSTFFVILPKSGMSCRTYNGAPCYAVAVWDTDQRTFNRVGKY